MAETTQPRAATTHAYSALAESSRQNTITGANKYLALLLLCVSLILGMGSGYLIRGHSSGSPGITSITGASVPSEQVSSVIPMDFPGNYTPPTSGSLDTTSMNVAGVTLEPTSPVNPTILPNSYTLPASFGDIGPQLLAAGAIDYDRFVQLYAEAEQPLTEEQLKILTKGSNTPVVINWENAYFLLNFFWAFGLANQNAVLETGPMKQNSEDGDIGGFASTGGWTLGTKPATDLYASTPIVTLTPEQQARLEAVAQAVYRPCCDNPTDFPDCNHGMAMLGLLELMAAQGATEDEMFTAAKYLNAFWFPQQTLEMATFFKHTQNLDFAQVDAREFVGPKVSSGTGFQAIHQWLATNNLLDQSANRGGNCAVQ